MKNLFLHILGLILVHPYDLDLKVWCVPQAAPYLTTALFHQLNFDLNILIIIIRYTIWAQNILSFAYTLFIEMMGLECNTLLSAPCFSPDSTSFSQSIQQGHVEVSGSVEGSPRFPLISSHGLFWFLVMVYLDFLFWQRIFRPSCFYLVLTTL